MTYDEIHPTFRNAIGTHEAFRKLRYPAQDIFLHRNPDGEILVILQQGSKRFSVTVGVVSFDQPIFEDEWRKLTLAVNGRQVSESDFQKCLDESPPMQDVVGFSIGLLQKGFKDHV